MINEYKETTILEKEKHIKTSFRCPNCGNVQTFYSSFIKNDLIENEEDFDLNSEQENDFICLKCNYFGNFEKII